MDNKVSVIVTCYNHGKYIKQCMESIFAQTHKNIDLLVINDGSTDNSDEIIKNTLEKSPFEVTEYVKQENAGICVTRNRGIEWIKGEFALFVDSDNYLDEEYIQLMLIQNADIAYGNLVDADSHEVLVATKEYDLGEHLKSNFIDNCSLIRTSKIGDARYDLELNRKKLVDYDFFLNLVVNNNAKPSATPKANLFYRVLEDSISRVNDHASEKYYFEVYLYILKKHVVVQSEKVFEAIKFNIFSIEDRHDENLLKIVYQEKIIYDKDVHIKNQDKILRDKDNIIYDKDIHINNLQQYKNAVENHKLIKLLRRIKK
jgi:glycosyltransferase involved in cell wall biosynthesis